MGNSHNVSSVQLTPDEIMADVQKRSLTHRICNAYESGMGRGLSGRDLSQPYEPTCEEGIAYAFGWYQGRGRSEVSSVRCVVQPTRCDCHPETCCCLPFEIVRGDERIASGTDRAKLEEMVKPDAAENGKCVHEWSGPDIPGAARIYRCLHGCGTIMDRFGNLTAKSGAAENVVSPEEWHDDDRDDDSTYCECGAFHGEEEEASNCCSCCGLPIDLNSEPV